MKPAYRLLPFFTVCLILAAPAHAKPLGCSPWATEIEQKGQALVRKAEASNKTAASSASIREGNDALYVYLAIQPPPPSARGAGIGDHGVSQRAMEYTRSLTRTRLEHPDQQNNKAEALLKAGKFEEAFMVWEAATRQPENLANLKYQAYLRNRMGVARMALGRSAVAIQDFRQALQWLGKLDPLGRIDLEIDTYISLGAALTFQGEYAEAILILTQARKLLIPMTHSVQGEANTAVSVIGEIAMRLPQHTGDPPEVRLSGVEMNLSVVYRALGKYDKALEHAAEAVRRVERFSAMGSHTAQLSNLALIQMDLGNLDQAAQVMEKVLESRRTWLGPQHLDTLSALHNLGGVHMARNDPEAALPLFREALSLRVNLLGWDHPRTVTSLLALGKAHQRLKQADPAGCAFSRAFAGAIITGEPLLAAQTAWDLAKWHAEAGDLDVAVYFGKRAVNGLQQLRAKASKLDSSLQKSLREQYDDIYARLADWMMARGRLPEAQQVLAMLKEEELSHFVQRSGTDNPLKTQASPTEQETPWNARYEVISHRLAALGKERDSLMKKGNARSAEENARKDELDKSLALARQAYDAFMAELRREFQASGSARQQEIGEKNLGSLRALQGTLRDLGHGAVTMHYLMAEKRLWILLTTPHVQIKRESPIGEAELNRKIGTFRQAIERRDPEVNALGLALHELLIQPIAEDLRQAGAQTLMLSLDGALRYLPMAALHDGKQYLAQRYRLALFTEAAKDKLKDKPQTDWTLAAYGMTQSAEGLPALDAVKDELRGILKNLKGEARLDRDFTASSFKAGLEASPPVVHLASHFVFQPGNETHSYLLLGDGKRLSLKELKDNYEFINLDLLTLSACNTAVGGGKDTNGREIEGFGALAQNQGARGVIATLWPVADQSTGQFMQLFYGIRNSRPGITKAEALQQAQAAFIEGRVAKMLSEVRRGFDDSEPPPPGVTTNHPYYWAPFILMGNWL
jgi:CHAT domain-containing protein